MGLKGFFEGKLTILVERLKSDQNGIESHKVV